MKIKDRITKRDIIIIMTKTKSNSITANNQIINKEMSIIKLIIIETNIIKIINNIRITLTVITIAIILSNGKTKINMIIITSNNDKGATQN